MCANQIENSFGTITVHVIDLNHTFISSNTTISNAARNLPSILRFVQRRQHTAGVLTVGKKSWFVLFVCVRYVIK